MLKGYRKKNKNTFISIDPDEVFLDATNLPQYDMDQFEGRIEKPLNSKAILFITLCFFLLVAGFFGKIWKLQIKDGAYFAEKSVKNTLRRDVVFADRGIITDRNGELLAWNETSQDSEIPKRKYIDGEGFSTLLGFIKYPKKDSSGNFYTDKTEGQDGVEKYFDNLLAGENGVRLTEVDVKGNVQSQSVVNPPKNGPTIKISIDSKLQDRFEHYIANGVDESGFLGGAGVIMDAKSGEVLALASYPDYDGEIMTEGKDVASINSFFNSKRNPFLDRAVSGLFAPGSTVKPFIGLGVLNEGIISPEKRILSTGSITVPNPYDPKKPTILKDWRVNGWTNMAEAISVSSDVYFYAVGAGYQDQKGLGIAKIDEYMKYFMFGTSTTGFFSGPNGVIPTPEWKKENFDGEAWVLGDSYHTAIGQYGFQVSPLQMARALTGIVNEGKIAEPLILKGDSPNFNYLPSIKKQDYNVIKEGMRLAVTKGTAGALLIPDLPVAAKTGTAEVGAQKQFVNSWVVGFFPYDNPRYTFAVVLERGPPTYKISAMRVMGSTLNWLKENAPQYAKASEIAERN